MEVVQWKVENREGKGGEPWGREGTEVPISFPVSLTQLCNEGKMLLHTGRAGGRREAAGRTQGGMIQLEMSGAETVFYEADLRCVLHVLFHGFILRCSRLKDARLNYWLDYIYCTVGLLGLRGQQEPRVYSAEVTTRKLSPGLSGGMMVGRRRMRGPSDILAQGPNLTFSLTLH